MKKTKAMLAAAVAGILGAATAPVQAKEMPKEKKASDGAHKCSGAGCGGMKVASAGGSDSVSCWGVNKCSGTGKCGGPEGNSCAGTNSCKGKGWLPMPKDSCLAIDGG